MNDTVLYKIPGLPVWGTVPGSPAAKAGIKVGDIILTVDGKPTPDVKTYWEVSKNKTSQSKVEVYRDGKILQFTIDFSVKIIS